MGGQPLHYLVTPLRTSGHGGDKERPSKGQGGNSEDCTDNEDTQMCSLMLIPITLNVECRLYIYMMVVPFPIHSKVDVSILISSMYS